MPPLAVRPPRNVKPRIVAFAQRNTHRTAPSPQPQEFAFAVADAPSMIVASGPSRDSSVTYDGTTTRAGVVGVWLILQSMAGFSKVEPEVANPGLNVVAYLTNFAFAAVKSVAVVA